MIVTQVFLWKYSELYCTINYSLNLSSTGKGPQIPQSSALNFTYCCLTGCHALFFPVPAGSPLLLSPTLQESTHPYYPNKAQALTVHNGTPVPPRYLIRGHSAALSPAVFASDNGMPLSLNHHYGGVASRANAVHIQKGLLALASHGNTNFTSFNPPNVQYQPGFCSPGEHDIR